MKCLECGKWMQDTKGSGLYQKTPKCTGLIVYQTEINAQSDCSPCGLYKPKFSNWSTEHGTCS